MKRILIYLCIPFLLLTACDKWLDVVPEEDIATIDSEFETYDQAYKWLQSAYVYLQDIYMRILSIEHWATDEVVADNYMRNSAGHPEGLDIIQGFQNVLSPYGDVWFKKYSTYRRDFYTYINLCNHFISRVDSIYNLEVADKKEWKAEVVALKAFYYFELVRRYGPVVIVPERFDPNQDVEALKLPRSHVDSCFNHIVRLCDEALPYLPSITVKKSERRGYFNKEAAMALKARALCYQASDLFNGNPDYANFTNKRGEPLFSAEKDPQKWKRAADAAIELIDYCFENGSASLEKGSSANTELQGYMLDVEKSLRTSNWMSNEVLYMVRTRPDLGMYQYTLPAFDDGSMHNLSGACLVPTMKMAEMFYTANGLPIDQDLKWVGNPYSLGEETDPKYVDVVALNEPVLNLHRRREPRFYANIAADRCYWRLGTRVEQNYLVEMYQGEPFGLEQKRLSTTTPQNITGYYLKKWCRSDATIANHASALQSFGEQPFPIFRLAEAYMIAAEALNEYKEAPDAEVYKYLNEIRRRAGIPDVEEAWKNAKNPNQVKTKTGMRDIIRQEWNIEFAFEGYRFWNVRRWKIANIELNEKVYGWNVVGNSAKSFYNDGKGPVIVFSGNKFVAPRDYLYPIRSEEIQTSGCVQNPGW